MEFVMSDRLKEVFEEYRKVYQEYFQYLASDMPSDEVLVMIALRHDMETIKEYMCLRDKLRERHVFTR